MSSLGCLNCRTTIVEAAAEHGHNPHDISFVDTVELLRASAPHFAAAPSDTLDSMAERLRADIASFVNPRPRRKRQCPRRVKQKMSKWHIKRAEHQEVRADFAVELELLTPADAPAA